MQLRHLAVTLCAVVIALTSVVLGDTARTGGPIACTGRRLARQQRQRITSRQRKVTRRRQQMHLDVEPSTTNETLSPAEKETTEEATTSDWSEMTTPRPTQNNDRWRATQRDKFIRIFFIQSEIISRLGLKRMPNASYSGYSNEEIESFEEIYNKIALANAQRTDNVPTDYYAKQFQALMPSCSVPRKTDDVWKSSEAYRLYFVVEPPDEVIKKETNVTLANLHLFKMPADTAAQPSTSTAITETMTPKRSGNRRQRLNRRRQQRRAARPSVRRRQMTTVDADSGREDVDDRAGRPREEALVEYQAYFKVSVYQYIRPVKHRRRPRKKLLDSVRVSRDYVGWVSLDIVEAVMFWFRRPQRNFGIEVSIQDERRRTYNTMDMIASINCSGDAADMKRKIVPLSLLYNNNNGDPMSIDMNYTDPSLEILSYEIPKERESREKRATSNGWFRNSSTCVKETFYVSFKDLGWHDWIIQPEGFEAAVCSGTCPGRVKFGPNHIHQKEKVVFEEKCGPSRLQPFSILHYDDSGNLTVSVLDDFTIADCGCYP